MKKKTTFFIFISTILAFAALCYYHIVELGFSVVDDDWMLLDNPLVSSMHGSFSWFKDMFTHFWNIQYSPLNTLYYACIYQINGFDPYYFHLFSLLIHIVNSLLLYILSTRLLKVFNKTHNVVTICSLVSLLWLVLPINVETVAWISASKLLLCTTFTIISLISFVDILTKGAIYSYLICLLSFIASFFFKEQAVLTPVMLVLALVFYKKVQTKDIKNVTFLFAFLILLLLLSAGFGVITINANKTAFYIFPFFQRMILSFYCFHVYIFNSIIPIRLRYNYPFPMNKGGALPILYFVFPFLFFITMFLLKSYLFNRKFIFELFCFLLFVIQIMLLLQIVPLNRPALFADRYMYLSSYFLFLALIHNGVSLNIKTKFKYQPMFTILLTCFFLFYIVYTNILVTHWNIKIIQ